VQPSQRDSIPVLIRITYLDARFSRFPCAGKVSLKQEFQDTGENLRPQYRTARFLKESRPEAFIPADIYLLRYKQLSIPLVLPFDQFENPFGGFIREQLMRPPQKPRL
jgi:hypothetical protein